jgi:hypothetical protein
MMLVATTMVATTMVATAMKATATDPAGSLVNGIFFSAEVLRNISVRTSSLLNGSPVA